MTRLADASSRSRRPDAAATPATARQPAEHGPDEDGDHRRSDGPRDDEHHDGEAAAGAAATAYCQPRRTKCWSPCARPAQTGEGERQRSHGEGGHPREPQHQRDGKGTPTTVTTVSTATAGRAPRAPSRLGRGDTAGDTVCTARETTSPMTRRLVSVLSSPKEAGPRTRAPTTDARTRAPGPRRDLRRPGRLPGRADRGAVPVRTTSLTVLPGVVHGSAATRHDRRPVAGRGARPPGDAR